MSVDSKEVNSGSLQVAQGRILFAKLDEHFEKGI
jgi:hypothetical protein